MRKSGNRYVTIGGETLTIASVARRHGFARGVLYGRLTLGWSLEKALSTPVKVQARRALLPEPMPGISRGTARARLRLGWSLDDALTTPVYPWRRLGINVADLAAERGLSVGAVRQRLAAGWPVEKALSTPLRAKAARVAASGW